ncbi:hypothetical protein HPP92_009268 [Vanilla planifolia]|uniref:SWI/SNF complex subunit SWI3D n=1 Tax=Vanilla planifolia TaxID=51239 RepID=A0A835RJ04_VANPL|nr:hypothetical protein HPP92_009268 [Vanilla planifolia]
METRGGRDAQTVVAIAEAKPLPASETLAEGSRRRTGGQKRKAGSSLSSISTASAPFPATPPVSSSSVPLKRLVKERNALNIPPIVGHNGPWTRARQTPNKYAASSPQKAQDGAAASEGAALEGGRDPLAAVEVTGAAEVVSVSQDEAIVDAEFEAVRLRGCHVHVVPTPAGWFSWSVIHELEKHALPSFFNGQSESKTPEIYLEIRNSIMKKFHTDPQTQLDVKDLSDFCAGDLGARQEVMEFLDYWGLINFHPFPHSAANETAGEGADKPSSLLDQLYQFDNPESLPCEGSKKRVASPPSMLPHLLPEPTFLDDMVRHVDPSVDYHCNSCSADCSHKRYHCQKQADFDLCVDCYNNGKFGSGMTPADFILMESVEGPGVNFGSWTDQETLLLLEALELFGENWNEIAEHVATKTKAQCIMHFLQMPIEDPFLDGKDNAYDNVQDKAEPCSANVELSAANASEAGEHNGMSDVQPNSFPADVSERKDTDVDQPCEHLSFAVNALKSAFQAIDYTYEEGKPFSFAEAGNPVMVVAAFLAKLVDQDVAGTSARSSLRALSEESPGIQLASRHCFILEDPPVDASAPLASESVADIGSGDGLKEEDQLHNLDGSSELKNGEEDSQAIAASSQNEMKQSATHEGSQKSSPEKESSISFQLVDSRGDTHSDDKCEDRTCQLDTKEAYDVKDPVLSTTYSNVVIALPRQIGAAPNVVKVVDTLNVTEENIPNCTDHSCDKESLDVEQLSESTKAVDTMPTSVVKKDEELQDNDVLSTKCASEMFEGDNKMASSPKNDSSLPSASENHAMHSMRRAAVSFLSAAAVKAKLLADQEEEKILQLVSFVIEKQLSKMETKLSFFSEMEGVMMRAKEKTERARQKLMHERAQIIAARLGLPPPTSRTYPTTLSAAKLAVGYGNVISRSQGMASQKSQPTRRP